MEILQRRSLRPIELVSRPSILISPSRPSLNKRKSAEMKEDLPAPVRPTIPTFPPGSMDTFRFCKARLRVKTQIMFVRMNRRFILYLQNWWIIHMIFHVDILQDQLSLGWPCRWRWIVWNNRFLLGKVRVLKNLFHVGHQWHRLAKLFYGVSYTND